jgi:hypothetical protein
MQKVIISLQRAALTHPLPPSRLPLDFIWGRKKLKLKKNR